MLHLRKLYRTAAVGGLLILAGNPLADAVGLKYWTPGYNPEGLSIHAYQASGSSATVLFVGSSRTKALFVPSIVEERLGRVRAAPVLAFNLGQDRSNLLGSAIILRDVLASNGCPDALVVELGPRAPNVNTPPTPRVLASYASLGDIVRLAPALRTPEQIGSAASGLLRGHVNLVLAARHGPRSRRGREQLDAMWERRGAVYQGPPLDRPSAVPDADWDRLWRRVLSGITGDDRVDRSSRAALRGIVDRAERCRAALWLVSPPTAEPYGEAYRAMEDSLDALVAEIAAPRGVAWIDLDRVDIGWRRSDFRDPRHVNEAGARKATEWLIDEILLPREATGAPAEPGGGRLSSP